jgi:hypothetical protein
MPGRVFWFLSTGGWPLGIVCIKARLGTARELRFDPL